ncbi:hypothetical protein Tco_1114484 [Tanacetum coccineum]|uniref:Uncharacterized protein n=1 Tax=Tanacetum coccineum TaxID=301880 RepID=A0ABQ5IW92_9ASTR
MSNTLNAYSAATQFYTYYAFASGKKTPKPKYVRKKAEPDTSPKHKHVQATKEVGITEVNNLSGLKEQDTILQSHASGSGDGVDTQSKVPDEQQQKTSGTDEGTGTIPGVPDVPIYESESDDNNDGDDDEANDDDKQEGDDTNDDDEETDTHKTKSDIIKIPILDQSTIKFYEEEENINDEETMYDDEEMMYDDEDDEVTKELYEDVNVNLGNEDTEMTNVDQGATDQQNVSQQSGFTQEEEDAHVTLTPVLNTQRSGAHHAHNPEITSSFTITDPPPPPFFNPLSQQATPTLTPTASETTTSLPTLLDFASVFKFNERVFNLEKDLIHDEAMIETSAGSRQWEGKKVSSKEYETSNDYRSKEKKSLWRKT